MTKRQMFASLGLSRGEDWSTATAEYTPSLLHIKHTLTHTISLSDTTLVP